MATYRDITLEIADRIATLTINLPESRNPISGKTTVEEIEDACRSVQNNDEVSVLVVTGAGRAFSAGGNVKNMQQRSEGFGTLALKVVDDVYRRGIQRIPLALDGLDTPIIAAVNGPAIGAGCDLAMMADIRIASTQARFGETFLNLGLIPGDGGSWYLTRQIGYQKAAEITFTGRLVDAQEALSLGMVLKVVEPEQLIPETLQLARTIADKPPLQLRLAKRLLKQSQRLQLKDFLDLCALGNATSHQTEDHREGLAALMEKRTPVFKGR
ncbi:MAG TPA: enoyl-CoA hydratase-related protein [bacterium]|nr:enoyl-CoA hydratase-related protein [bacterium]